MKIKPNTWEILGVSIDSTSEKKVLEKIESLLSKKEKFYIVTPNPEIILIAKKDKHLRKILNNSDISVPDGIGIVAASKYLRMNLPENKIFRIPIMLVQGLFVGMSIIMRRGWLEKEMGLIKGRKLFLKLCSLGNKNNWRMYLLGGTEGVAKDASKKISNEFRKVKIKYQQGPNIGYDGKPVKEEDRKIERDVIREINSYKPHLLFVAFGAPKQEKWVDIHLSSLDIGGAMVVGGTFDYENYICLPSISFASILV
jgi:N-acetylglucosaminyldiphosphoundecaprenol N-acetyl-beta-D-mannosaminyltransferase